MPTILPHESGTGWVIHDEDRVIARVDGSAFDYEEAESLLDWLENRAEEQTKCTAS